MAGEIYIADKSTLDLTKANTDTIKLDTTIIKTNVEEIKNNFPINTDSQYKFFNAITQNTGTISAGTNKTVFEIQGAGYLNAFYFKGKTSGKAFADIYIDNELIYSTGLYSTDDSVFGIFQTTIYNTGFLSIPTYNDYKSLGINPSTPSHPADNYTVLIPEKLYFNNNFRVIAKNTDTINLSGYEFTFLGAKLNI
jgi:hypothetical protein